MCSSSKVKCNKEKPVCSRCRKLGYPCFYSPARRIGRPHPNRRSISRKSPEPRPTHSRAESAVNTSAPNTPQDSQTLCQDPQARLETQPSILDENESSSGVTYGPGPLHWPDEMYMSTGCVGETETNLTTSTMNGGSYVLNEALRQKQSMIVPQSPVVDLELFNFSDALNEDSQWLHSLQRHVNSTLTPLEFPLPQITSQSSSSMATDALEIASCDQTPISDSAEQDCVTRAIDILRRLQTSNKTGDETQNSAPEQELPTRVQTAAWAINRLSTILVCPCSRKTYVGMAVASVCMVIMDIYESLFQGSHHKKVGGHTIIQAQDMDLGYSRCLNVNHNECPAMECAESADSESDEGEPYMSSVHILEELSKLANVVMQFARRYKGDSYTQPVGTLSALADSLKLRLRSITNEAFERGLR